MKKYNQEKNSKKKREWVDFSLKINYIYENLFKNNKEQLLNSFFSDIRSEDDRKKSLKTINNWLSGKSKKPYKFNLEHCKIGDYSMPDGSSLFTKDMFEFWSIESFRDKLDEYLHIQDKSSSLEKRMRYIYYFDLDSETLSYYELGFPNINNTYKINLYSRRLAQNMFYQGEIVEFEGMLYISVKNEFDYMQFIFENVATILNQEVRVFGTAQCKDISARKPKAYMVLLSSNLLTKDEEQHYQHKLNYSNLLIAYPFKRQTVKNRTFLVENFTKKIKDLAKDIEPHKKEQDFYTNLALHTFSAYEKIAKKLYYNESYFVSNKKSIKNLLFNSLAKNENLDRDEAPRVDIAYTLTPSNISLLEVDSPYFSEIFQEQIYLVEEHRLKIHYLFVVSDCQLMTHKVVQKLIKLAKILPIKIVENSHPHYEEIILPQNKNFILYQTYNDEGRYLHITKHTKDKIDIAREYKRRYNQALSLDEFIEQSYPLNGKWYCYSFGSQIDENHYHTMEIEIDNNNIIGNFLLGIYHGKLEKYKEFTLLLFNNSLIKLRNSVIKDKIFRISIISQELNLDHKDLLLFGIMSKEELKKEEILKLLKSIHKREPEDFRLKIDDGFDSFLGSYLSESNTILTQS